MMPNLSNPEIAEVFIEANLACVVGVSKDLFKAIVALGDVSGLLEGCMKAMAVSAP